MGLVSSLGAMLRQYSFAVITERMVMRVRCSVFTRIHRQHVGWFDASGEHTAGSLVNQLAQDCFLIKGLTGERASLALSQGVVLIGGLYVSFSASWQLTLVVFAIIPLIVVPIAISGKFVARFADASNVSVVDSGRTVAECMQHLRTVASLCAEENRAQHFAELLALPEQQDIRKGVATGLGMGVASGVVLP